ncbi:MAG: type II secretion system F family protein, partial [Bryobacterales bacterium]|nr:type II secretion system F family protein [Bryobacterales bacterium]
MAEFVLKYADARGRIHQKTEEADTESQLRQAYSQQGYLVYSVKAKSAVDQVSAGMLGRRKRLQLENFLIFNQQFVTLIRAGLPILKALDLLAERFADPRMVGYLRRIRDEVKGGALLSEAFRAAKIFPPIYVTSLMAGEKAGSLEEVLDRYIQYQQLTLAVRKKLLVSLIYPCFLIILVFLLVVFLVTYVVPSFSDLYNSMSTELPLITQWLIAFGTTSRSYVLGFFAALLAGVAAFQWWSRGEAAQERLDRWKLRMPLAGDIWIKFQVSQFSRILGTLLVGGIPLLPALETAAESLNSRLLRISIAKASRMVKEGQPLSKSLAATGIFPGLSIDMIEVGESTGALPTMLTSVAEFFEGDVSTRLTAALSLIEPLIMIVMGAFVAFVLIALYLPIFSL